MWQNHLIKENKRQRNPKGQSGIDNPNWQHRVHKTQKEDKRNETPQRNMCWITLCANKQK